MCVIIIKQKGNVLSHEVAQTSAEINPHGLGIVWLDTFEVTYHKSREYEQLITDRPFIAHFRYATVGKIGLSNTHPFVCGNNEDELLMQNGTIRGLGTTEMCDSKVLAIKLGDIDRRHWKKELEQHDSRFVSVNLKTKTFQIYNKNLYTYKDGVWYSKANVLQDNVIATYGTLKKGFSNHPRFLSKAKHLGSGVTKDKYPLIVEGLPYLVKKKGFGHNVKVDVFKVSDASFKDIDMLEGHPKWYKREQVEIKMDDGNTRLCWVYFNEKELSGSEELHQSYELAVRPFQEYFNRYEPIEDEIDFDEQIEAEQMAIDIGFDSDYTPSREELSCVACFNDVEYDGFHNYYCSSCGGWFKEHEVLTYN